MLERMAFGSGDWKSRARLEGELNVLGGVRWQIGTGRSFPDKVHSVLRKLDKAAPVWDTFWQRPRHDFAQAGFDICESSLSQYERLKLYPTLKTLRGNRRKICQFQAWARKRGIWSMSSPFPMVNFAFVSLGRGTPCPKPASKIYDTYPRWWPGLANPDTPFSECPWGRLDYICNSKTSKSVSVIWGKLIRKQFKSVSVISRLQV